MVQTKKVLWRAKNLFCFTLGLLLALQVAPTAAQSDELEELRRMLAEQKKMLEQQRQQMEQRSRQMKELEQRLERLTGKEVGAKPAATVKKEPVPSRQEQKVASPKTEQPKQKSAQTQQVGKPPTDNRRKVEAVEAIASISDEVRGVLTPRGKLVLDPSLKYAHSSNNRVFVEGFGPLVLPSLFLGLLDIREVDRDLWIASLAARYGITSRMQFEVKVPYVWREDSIRSRPFVTNLFGDKVYEVDGSGLGDVEFALDYQLNRGLNGWPFFIGGVRVSAPTGTDPFEVETVDFTDANGDTIERFPTELATGSGFWSIQPSLTFLFPTDPAVFFGTLSYTWSIEDDFGNDVGEIDPGDTIGLSGGMGFGINERSSFSLGFSYKHVDETTQNGNNLKGSDLDIGEVSLGYSYRLSRNTNLNLSVGVGATEDAQDFQLTVRLPTTFGLF